MTHAGRVLTRQEAAARGSTMQSSDLTPVLEIWIDSDGREVKQGAIYWIDSDGKIPKIPKLPPGP